MKLVGRRELQVIDRGSESGINGTFFSQEYLKRSTRLENVS